MPALPSQQPAPAAACFPNQPSAINFSFPFLFFSPPLSRGSGSSSALCAPLASPERFISEKSLWPDSRRPGAHRPAYTWASLRGSPSRRVPPPPTPRRGAGPHWALWERPQSHQARSCGSGRGRGGWGGGPRGGVPLVPRSPRPGALCPRESADPPRRPAGRAGRAAGTHAADSAGRARSSPAPSRAPRARPCGSASFPRRPRRDAQSARHCLARPGRAAPRPSARAWGGRNSLFPLPSLFGPGTASPSPWLPLT